VCKYIVSRLHTTHWAARSNETFAITDVQGNCSTVEQVGTAIAL